MSVAYIINETTALIVFPSNGKSYTIDSSHPNWTAVTEKLVNEDYDGLEELVSVKKSLETYVASVSDVEIDDNGVKYKGVYVDNYLTQKMLNFANKGLPVKPLVNFFSKLMENPSSRSVEYLYKFLEHRSMPILANGNFLAYKSVRPDWKDWHTGTVDNSVGTQVPEMPRNMVDDDPKNGCSRGYHAGSLAYAKSFNSGGHLVIVEINPKDCVMVPYDCGFQKLRCTTYLVVSEYEKTLDDDYDSRRDDESLYECDHECDDSECCYEIGDVQEQIEELEGLISDIKYRISNEMLNSEQLAALSGELIEMQAELEELEGE